MRNAGWSRRATSAAFALLVACSGGGRQIHGTREDPAGGTLEQMDLLDARTGWALTSTRLVVTTDGGKVWRDRTPIDIPGGALTAAFMLRSAHAWSAGLDPDGTMLIYRSADAGRSWRSAKLRSSYPDGVGRVTIQFVDARTGWIDVERVHGSALDTADLYGTHDGGATWTRLPLPGGQGSRFRFADATRGWLVAGPNHERLFFTRDGGRTWRRARVEPQHLDCLPRTPCAQPRTPCLIPPFAFGRTATLVATYTQGARILSLYTSENGLSWFRIGNNPIDSAIGAGVCLAAHAFAARHVIWYDAGQFGVRAQGGCCQGFGARGLPAMLDALDFVDPKIGWAQGTAPDAWLYATADGGRTWRRLDP